MLLQTKIWKPWKWETTKKISLLRFNQAGRQKVLQFLMEKKSIGKNKITSKKNKITWNRKNLKNHIGNEWNKIEKSGS